MSDNQKIRADFCLEIDFDKGSKNPSRVFQAMSALIESFEKIDHSLAISIDSKIEPILLLEDIDKGSLRVWLINQLKEMDDETLKSGDIKKIIGPYLVKAKYCIVDYLEKKTSITDENEIRVLQDKLFEMAKETDIRHLPAYVPIQKTKLLEGISDITNALSYLNPKDKASYITDDKTASFNMDFKFAPEKIEELITKEKNTNEVTQIIKVKKPDYLGESMWEFLHGKNHINAKIIDNDWLTKFQNRNIEVRPGESLRVRMRIIDNYDYDNNLISTKYEILSINEV
jgi:hypothetical protein